MHLATDSSGMTSGVDLVAWFNDSSPVAVASGDSAICAANSEQCTLGDWFGGTAFSWLRAEIHYVNHVGPFSFDRTRRMMYRNQFQRFYDLPT